ncbi:hypothetical protein SynA1562_01669 [Synechococcus sp. A15-62]|nr:hypothetical protein SynA1562_01669 [Synechococcus sp. A15-62]
MLWIECYELLNKKFWLWQGANLMSDCSQLSAELVSNIPA